MKRAFSLVELMIVVAILGILAAIALPTFQGHVSEAKQAAARENLHILRAAIEFYAAQHNGLPPGYLNGEVADDAIFIIQMIYFTNESGQLSGVAYKTDTHPLGQYLNAIPKNPFNENSTVKLLEDAESFPEFPTGAFGWIYKPATKTIKLDWPGTDTEGVPYFDY